jgi:hypothetical protein
MEKQGKIPTQQLGAFALRRQVKCFSRPKMSFKRRMKHLHYPNEYEDRFLINEELLTTYCISNNYHFHPKKTHLRKTIEGSVDARYSD